MHARVVTGRVTRRWCCCLSGGRRGCLDDLLGRGDAELGEDVALGAGELGGLPEGARRAGEGAEGEQVQFVGDVVPGGAGGGLGDADQQEGEPAQDDVGADALLFAVVDRSQVDDLLEVTPAALGFQELLVAQGDVLGGQRGVGGAEQVLAVQVLLGLDLGGVGAQQTARGDPQVAVQAGPGGDDSPQLGPLGRGEGSKPP